MSVHVVESARTSESTGLSFLWLELTHKCNLECLHCYTNSSPMTPHGVMNTDEWKAVIADAAALGVRMVQFIGGEPTLYSDLGTLVDHASACGLSVEIYSNMTHISPALWECFSRNRVMLATSVYSEEAQVHDSVTVHRGSHAKTIKNIEIARGLDLQVRAGSIEVLPEQDAAKTEVFLGSIGAVSGSDRARGFGRQPLPINAEREKELCGNCTSGVAMIDPDGNVFPCVMSRWLPSGNVRQENLEAALNGGLAENRAHLNAKFNEATSAQSCAPQCSPTCNPINCQPRCQPMLPPCVPQNCQPMNEYCSPNYPGPR